MRRESFVGRVTHRFRGADSLDGLGELGGCLSADLGMITVVVILVLLVLLLIFVGIPLLLALVDLIVVIVVAVAGLVGRLVFGRPWVVEAVADNGIRHEWRVVGWRRSGQRRDEVRQLLAAGADLPPEGR